MKMDRDVVRAATDELGRIPGVFMVADGLRWKNGQLTDQPAIVVYVRRKRPSEEIAPRERIPREIHGIPTDVLEGDPPVSTESDPAQPTLEELPWADDKEYAQIRGGIRCEGAGGTGTIACIARATDAQNAGKLVALSNHHVLLPEKGSGFGASVYQPASSCCCCGRKIAKVLRGRYTKTGAFYKRSADMSIDAGLALLNPGLQCLAEQQIGVGGGTTDLVQGVLPTASMVMGMAVKKRGARSGATNGTIMHLHADARPKDNDDKAFAFRDQLLITPTMPAGTTTGLFRFQVGGDSGSALMTATGDNIVGLMHASSTARPSPGLTIVNGIATDINAVATAMQITILTANTLGQIITVPATNVLPTSSTLIPTAAPAFTRTVLEQARVQIEATAAGRAYAEVVRRHHGEVQALVRTNRRVGAIWKRYGGQGIVQAVLDAVGRPDAPIPAVVASRQLVECAARIAGVLKRYGSAALARDAAAYEKLVSALPGRSYHQLLRRLQAGEALES